MSDELTVLSRQGPCIYFSTKDKKNILFLFGIRSEKNFNHIKISNILMIFLNFKIQISVLLYLFIISLRYVFSLMSPNSINTQLFIIILVSYMASSSSYRDCG